MKVKIDYFLYSLSIGCLCISSIAYADCGDGVREDDEICDDGNSNNCDSCTNSCTLGPFLDMVTIPGGTYTMGNNAYRSARYEHDVTLEDFQVSRSEITVSQYRSCVEAGACSALSSRRFCQYSAQNGKRDERPVNCLTWYQAQDFVDWCNEDVAVDAHQVSLPTESQWEYIASENGTRYPTGKSKPSRNQVYYNQRRKGPTDVCSVGVNEVDGLMVQTAYNLCDLSGNVLEWLEDNYYRPYGNNHPTDGSAFTIDTGRYSQYATFRGGSYASRNVSTLWTSHRSGGRMSRANPRVGFRVACSVEGDEGCVGKPIEISTALSGCEDYRVGTPTLECYCSYIRSLGEMPPEMCPCTEDADCDNGVFCDGAEICDNSTCQAGVPPTTDDGVGCTDDACDEANDQVTHTPNDSLCDDTLFCNGSETCDAINDCQAGVVPTLDDGVGCTVDVCDEANDQVTNTPNNASCDDGLFCNGSETCDAINDCQAGVAPTLDDGVGCTDDACDEANDQVTNTPNNASCDDGLFCNGSETCDAINDCQAGVAPNIDDGVGCTIDACDEANDQVTNTPNNASCDDGLFCNGSETCNVINGCQAGVAPNIDDGVACTTDSCDEANDQIVNDTSTCNHVCDTSCGVRFANSCWCDAQCQGFGDCCTADGTGQTNSCAGSTCASCQ